MRNFYEHTKFFLVEFRNEIRIIYRRRFIVVCCILKAVHTLKYSLLQLIESQTRIPSERQMNGGVEWN